MSKVKPNYLMKIKTKCTQYLNYDYEFYSDFKPDYGKLNEDYTIIRAGSILYIRYEFDEDDDLRPPYKGYYKNGNCPICFDELDDIKNNYLFEILEDLSEVNSDEI